MLFRSDYYPTKVIEKGNSETGIPLGILGLFPIDYSLFDWLRLIIRSPFGLLYLRGTTYLVVEMGVDDPYPPKNLGYLLTIVRPDIAVLLNAYPVHTMQFEKTLTDMEIKETRCSLEKRTELLTQKIAREKSKIITESGCRVWIFNNDNQNIKNEILKIKNSNQKLELFSFGNDSINNIYYQNYEVNLKGSRFSFISGNNNIEIKINNYLLPKEYREILAAGILVGKAVKLNDKQIIKSMEKNFHLPKSRASLLSGINNSIIIDSSYNASRAAVLAFLNMAYQIKIDYKKSLIFIFGDMRELGEEAEVEHKRVLDKILQTVDYLYCVGELTKRFVIDKFKVENEKLKVTVKSLKLKEVKWFKSSKDAGMYLRSHLPNNAIVLVKGSQNTIFLEETVKAILKNKKDIDKLCRQERFWLEKKG